jgi:hypothetical protein
MATKACCLKFCSSPKRKFLILPLQQIHCSSTYHYNSQAKTVRFFFMKLLVILLKRKKIPNGDNDFNDGKQIPDGRSIGRS